MATCNPTVMILRGGVRSVPRYAMRVIGQMVARDRVFRSLNVRSGWPGIRPGEGIVRNAATLTGGKRSA
jgi:hypothetical protein